MVPRVRKVGDGESLAGVVIVTLGHSLHHTTSIRLRQRSALTLGTSKGSTITNVYCHLVIKVTCRLYDETSSLRVHLVCRFARSSSGPTRRSTADAAGVTGMKRNRRARSIVQALPNCAIFVRHVFPVPKRTVLRALVGGYLRNEHLVGMGAKNRERIGVKVAVFFRKLCAQQRAAPVLNITASVVASGHDCSQKVVVRVSENGIYGSRPPERFAVAKLDPSGLGTAREKASGSSEKHISLKAHPGKNDC
mmetsp:Transcript_14407/g.26705  ORF Transcript_14407/g.26705 Transcript_14407/m.26705 type:complete len:250 (+) Transcript_14407:603-1352(+)